VVDALRRGDKPAAPEAEDNVLPLRRLRQAPARDDEAGRIRGLEPGLAVHFAGCCHPVPGDPIVGVVRTGRGVTVHRSECGTLGRRRADPERWLDLGWNPEAAESKGTARLQVMTLNQPGSLGSLSTAIGRQGGNITDVRFGARSPDLYEIILDVEVEDLDHLDRVVAGLRATPVVTYVERSQG
jgi:GTP pyrophosphokinase